MGMDTKTDYVGTSYVGTGLRPVQPSKARTSLTIQIRNRTTSGSYQDMALAISPASETNRLQPLSFRSIFAASRRDQPSDFFIGATTETPLTTD